MKKNKYIIVLIFVFLFFICIVGIFINYSNNTTIMQNNKNENLQEKDLKFITKKYCQYDKTKHINIDISYPEFNNFPDKTKQQNINDLIKESALNPYNKISNYDQGIAKGTSWSVDYNIVYVTDTVISIIFEGYLYVQDNANGINWIYSTNINLISGKKITMSDIFYNTFKDKLNFNHFKSIDTDPQDAEQSALDELFNYHKNDFDNSDDNFYFTKDKFIIILPIDNYYRFASDYADLLSTMREDNIIWKSIFAGYGISQYENRKENNIGLNTAKNQKLDAYELKNAISYNQLFYGKWKIVDYIPADLSLPSTYSGLDEAGNLKGPDVTKIIGKELSFEEDYAEYQGNKYQFAYGPVTYTHALQSEQEQIGYNFAKSLGITGEYYSIVYFLLPDNYQVDQSAKYIHEIRIDDLCYLYIKDNETIYASNGIITYLLKRLD
ncbi:PdaC/SigV domain-containing protein [Lacrimispora sp. AGF001]|uniref:PdaC/SigV domain-containing protein n=1 Tax=Lacrimispora sp. AGF001 TaxID=3401631 RepID=UPI003B433429